jgi:hypothetical protein
LDHGFASCVRGNLGSLRNGLTFQATRNARESILLAF